MEEVSYADLDDREADDDVIEDLSDGEGTEDDAKGLKDVDDANENGDVLAVGEVAAEKNDDLGVGKVAEDGEAVEENDILGDEEVAINEGVAVAALLAAVSACGHSGLLLPSLPCGPRFQFLTNGTEDQCACPVKDAAPAWTLTRVSVAPGMMLF